MFATIQQRVSYSGLCFCTHTHTYTCTHTRSHTHIQFPAAALINDTYSDHDPKAHSHTSQGSHTHTTLTSQGSLTYIPRLTHTHVHTHQGSLTQFPRLTHTHTHRAHVTSKLKSHTALFMLKHPVFKSWLVHTHAHTHTHTHTQSPRDLKA
jgi:hypothetical protein